MLEDDEGFAPLEDFVGSGLERERLVAIARRGPARLPQRLVGYGFVDRAGCRAGTWQVQPQQPFRAQRLYLWPEGSATLSQISFAGVGQLVTEQPLPVELFLASCTLDGFLEECAEEGTPRDGEIRAFLHDLPEQLRLPYPPHFPTLEVGGCIEVRWEGSLQALFVCGRELLPQESSTPQTETDSEKEES